MGTNSISVVDPLEETISMREGRELRYCIQDFTNGCLLTKREYLEILLLLSKASERLEKSGQVAEGRKKFDKLN